MKTVSTLLFLLSISVYSICQIPDSIIYNGNSFPIYNTLLSSHPSKEMESFKNLFNNNILDKKSYIAIWEVIDSSLYLKKIRNVNYYKKSSKNESYNKIENSKFFTDSVGKEYAELKDLFTENYANGIVRADWVNESLYLPHGRILIDDIFNWYNVIYTNEIELLVENGYLKDKNILSNSETKLSNFIENNNLRKFFRDNTNLYNLPESDSLKRCIYVEVISGTVNGKIDSVKVLKGINELYDNEAVRLVKMIPEWEIIYKHGKKINRKWVIKVNFDLINLNEEITKRQHH